MTTQLNGAGLNVLIVDDSSIWAAGMAAALQNDPGIAAVNIAYTVEQGVHAATEHQPDVILLDLKIGADWGLRVARVLTFRKHPARIAIVTNESTPYARQEAAELGLVGFIDKSALDVDNLPPLVHAVSKRASPISPESEGLEAPLTDREVEFLVCFRDGLGTQAITQRLGIGEQRVRNATSDIGKKLCIAERVPGYDRHSLRLALVSEAIRLGIIAPSRPR